MVQGARPAERRIEPLTQRLLLTAIIGGIFFVSGCGTYNPFYLPQEEFYKKIKIIAVTVEIRDGIVDDPKPAIARLESLIEAKLREAGFLVVSAQETYALWHRLVGEVGGLSNPVTGQRDSAKIQIVREQLRHELRNKFKADALLTAVIFSMRIETLWRYESGYLRWHGTSEKIAGVTDQVTDLLYGSLTWGLVRSIPETLLALSLIFDVNDMSGALLYSKVGGIQVLEKISGGRVVPVPKEEILTNEERIRESVDIVLRPLVIKAVPRQ